MNTIPSPKRNSYYRITMVGDAWQVMRPGGSMPHAFGEFEDAMEFVRGDSDGKACFAEVVVGSLYMLKGTEPDR